MQKVVDCVTVTAKEANQPADLGCGRCPVARGGSSAAMQPWCAPDAEHWLRAHLKQLGCSKLDRSLAAQLVSSSERSPGSPPLLFLNVGANKGYEVAGLLETWAPHLGVSQASWFALIKARAAAIGSGYLRWTARGACDEGGTTGRGRRGRQAAQPPHEPPPTRPPALPSRALKIYAFEMHPATAQLLRHLINATHAAGLVEVVNAPVSDRSMPVPVPWRALARPPGTEGTQICTTCAERQVAHVNATSVDDFLRAAGLADASLEGVVVDTEGHDLHVLHGMRRALARRRVRHLEFEYSRYGAWRDALTRPEHSLARALAWLRALGYECFWLGPKGALVPASPPCWRHSFEHRTWSNLRCAAEPAVLGLLQRAAREQYGLRAGARGV